MGATVEIGRRPLGVAGIAAAARGPCTVLVDPQALARVAASAAWGDEVAARQPVYGRSTGVGANRVERVTPDRDRVMGLLASHATAAGERRSAPRVRATLLVRLQQLTAGGSGVSVAAAAGLAAMLTADALPALREWGSIGTGDLSALATTALALAGAAPTAPGVAPPVVLAAGDGLGLISSNAATVADAALATADLGNLVRAAVVVAALTGAATGINPAAFAPPVELASPFAGPVAVAGWLRALVRDLSPARLQDPFALRTLPQVLGPAVEAIDDAAGVVTASAAAPAENPLLLPGSRPAATHHGAFFGASLQLALDRMNLAVAAGAPAVLGRIGLLMDPASTGLAPFLADRAGDGRSGAMVLEYVAASVAGSLRAAAQPAGLQTVSLSRGVENDASYSSQSARQALVAADRYRVLLATELVAAVRALRLQDRDVPSALRPALGVVADLPAVMADRDLTPDLDLAAGRLDALAALLPTAADT